MTDYRSVEHLEVYRDGEHVANLRRRPKGCDFRYTDQYLDSNQPAIALHLPKSREGIQVQGLANLPTYFAGLLPEGVMFSAAQSLIGAAADDLFAILAATGADAIGDIDVRIPGEPERKPTLNLKEATQQIKSILGHGDRTAIQHLSGISGVQPKLSLGELVRSSRSARYIAKFDPPEFPDLTRNEFTMTRLAKLCRLNVSHTKLESGVLVIRRFDRTFEPKSNRLAKVHVEDMLQAMDLFPNSKYSLEYVELLQAMQQIGVSKAAMLEAIQLYVFSYIIGNGDLHAKNLSLLFDKEDRQWRLSPIYDLVTTLPYEEILPGASRMALALEDEAFGRFQLGHFTAFGKQFGLPEIAVTQMVTRTANLVLKHLPATAHNYLEPKHAGVIEGRAKSLTP